MTVIMVPGARNADWPESAASFWRGADVGVSSSSSATSLISPAPLPDARDRAILRMHDDRLDAPRLAGMRHIALCECRDRAQPLDAAVPLEKTQCAAVRIQCESMTVPAHSELPRAPSLRMERLTAVGHSPGGDFVPCTMRERGLL